MTENINIISTLLYLPKYVQAGRFVRGRFVRRKCPRLALPWTIKYFFVLNFWCIFRNGLLTKRPKVRHEIGRRIRKAKNCVSMFKFCHVTGFGPVYTGRNSGRGRDSLFSKLERGSLGSSLVHYDKHCKNNSFMNRNKNLYQQLCHVTSIPWNEFWKKSLPLKNDFCPRK